VFCNALIAAAVGSDMSESVPITVSESSLTLRSACGRCLFVSRSGPGVAESSMMDGMLAVVATRPSLT
jgi:hypothetical protein